jgi:hypothetical protein
MKKATLTVEIKHRTATRIRIKIGVWLIKLAANIIGVGEVTIIHNMRKDEQD